MHLRALGPEIALKKLSARFWNMEEPGYIKQIRRGSLEIRYFSSGNEHLDDSAQDFLGRNDCILWQAIDEPDRWEEMPGKAYRKKEVCRVNAEGTDLGPISLQLADCYDDPDIEIPGVPDHNHPSYSEFFWFPRGRGRLRVGDRENGYRTDLVVHRGTFAFIDGNMYHSVMPENDGERVYVALMRFDPELIEAFGEGCRFELID